MQIKIIIIGVLIGCSYLIGNYIYSSYTKRHEQVKELIRILETIRMDLSFGQYTLQEIFFRIGLKREYTVSTFFKNTSIELENSGHLGLESIVYKNKFILENETYLRQQDIEELMELILTLGKSDIDSQSRMIDLSIENLKKTTEDTREDVIKKGMVYKKLATIIGIMIGIVLI